MLIMALYTVLYILTKTPILFGYCIIQNYDHFFYYVAANVQTYCSISDNSTYIV